MGLRLLRTNENDCLGKRLKVVRTSGTTIFGIFLGTDETTVIANNTVPFPTKVAPLPAWKIEQANGHIFCAFPERDTISEDDGYFVD